MKAHQTWDVGTDPQQGATSATNSSNSSGIVHAQVHADKGEVLHKVYPMTSEESLSASNTDSSAGTGAKKPSGDRELETDKPSVGSLHDMGRCRPCHFLIKRTGCVLGDKCGFCHFEHDITQRHRPGKARRNQVKRVMEVLNVVARTHPGSYNTIAEKLATRCHYFRKVQEARAVSMEQEGGAIPASSSDARPGSSAAARGTAANSIANQFEQARGPSSSAAAAGGSAEESEVDMAQLKNGRSILAGRSRAGALELMLQGMLTEEGIHNHKLSL